MARPAANHSSFRTWARRKRSTAPASSPERPVAGACFLRSSAMIALQAVRRTRPGLGRLRESSRDPADRGIIVDAAEGFDGPLAPGRIHHALACEAGRKDGPSYPRRSRRAPDISPTSIESNCNQRVLSPVMPAKAGIQHGFDWTLNSRLRGNDTMIECDSV